MRAFSKAERRQSQNRVRALAAYRRRLCVVVNEKGLADLRIPQLLPAGRQRPNGLLAGCAGKERSWRERVDCHFACLDKKAGVV